MSIINQADYIINTYVRHSHWLDEHRQQQQDEALKQWDIAIEDYKKLLSEADEQDLMTEQQVAARLTLWALSLGIVIQADTVDDALDQIASQLDELPAPVVAQL